MATNLDKAIALPHGQPGAPLDPPLGPLLRNRLERQLLALGRFVDAHTAELVDSVLALDVTDFREGFDRSDRCESLIGSRLVHRELRILSDDLSKLAREHGLSVPQLLALLHETLTREYPS